MDLISVYTRHLKEILQQIKHEGIRIKIRNSSGQWSDRFYAIEEIKEIDHKEFKITILVLYDPIGRDSTAIDTKSISMVELGNLYQRDGKSYRTIHVQKDGIIKMVKKKPG